MESKRLKKIANMVPKSDKVADVGTDHGFLPIELLQSGQAREAYAMDINKGPLKKAYDNILKAGLIDKVKVIESDGLERLPEPVDTVIIAGMGGQLITSILSQSETKLMKIQTMVLSPHRDEEVLRRQLHQLGWKIQDESMVEEQGKYYTVIKAIKGKETYTAIEYLYGKCLIEKKTEVWKAYLHQLLERYKELFKRLDGHKTQNTQARQQVIKKKINQIEEII